MDATELAAFQQFKQIVVWGFPLHTHTHSYIHGAWVKTFKHLGLTVHWFHDGEHPSPATFDYSNTLFITEGWADDHIPVNATSTYFVHIAKNPAKYLDVGARLIEIRYNVLEINDYNYNYTLPTDAFALSRDTLYEVVKDDRAVAGRRGRATTAKPYEAVYMYWATDLLPHEFNFEDAAATEKLPAVFYIGSMDAEGHPFHAFRRACEAREIAVVQIDPWRTPVSYEENIALMKASYCAPDFRTTGSAEKAREYGKMNGTNHLEIGYIPCRVFKAISYGQTGITNSPRVKAILGKHVEYVADPAAVLEVVERRKADMEWRQAAMRHVAERHTFLQRARDLARALLMRGPPVVTALYDIGREAIDGRSMDEYRAWTLQTLQSIKDPVVLYLDARLAATWEETLLEVRHSVGPICILKTALEETPMWCYKDKVAAILANPARPTLYPQDITNRLPAYTLIQYSKFGWLEDAASRVLADFVVWMDAGFCRFFVGEGPFTLRHRLATVLGEKMSIEVSDSAALLEKITPDNYIGTNHCLLRGGLWVVAKSVLLSIRSAVMDVWEGEMLAKSRLDNEQIALALVCKKESHRFDLVVPNPLLGAHRSMFFHWFTSRT